MRVMLADVCFQGVKEHQKLKPRCLPATQLRRPRSGEADKNKHRLGKGDIRLIGV
jgi:hypothetical protein